MTMKTWSVVVIDNTMPCMAVGKFMKDLTKAEAKCIAKHMNRKICGLEMEAGTYIGIEYLAQCE